MAAPHTRPSAAGSDGARASGQGALPAQGEGPLPSAVLHHQEKGTGRRTTFLLHGFLGQGRNLLRLATAWLACDGTRRFVLPDLTGHGHSPPLPPQPTLETVARDLLALVHGYEGPVEVVGHSFGGRVALQAALLEPETIAAVTLLDISPSPVPEHAGTHALMRLLLEAPASAPSKEAMRAWFLERGLPRHLAEWLLMNLQRTASGELCWRIDRARLDALHRASNPIDLWAAVEAPASRVKLCVRGSKSPFVSDADARRLAACGVRVVTLEGAGHFLHVEALDALVAVLCGPGGGDGDGGKEAPGARAVGG